MPIAAEARVISTSIHFDEPAEFGFAIRAITRCRYAGQWPELASTREYARAMIMWPFTAIVGGNPVTEFIGGAIGEMAGSFSAVFCNPAAGGSPDLNIPTDLPPVQLDRPIERGLPETDAVRACNTRDANVELDERERLCEQAAIEEGRAKPGPEGEPNTECRYTSPQTLDENTPCEPCQDADGNPCPEFTYRASRAASECRPGGELPVSRWTYQRRDFEWRINLVPVPLARPAEGEELVIPDDEDRRYTIELVTEEPTHSDRGFDRVESPPCGPGGNIATTYNASSTYQSDGTYTSGQMLCEQQHLQPDTDSWVDESGEGTDGLTLTEWRDRFEHATWTEETEDYVPAPPADWDPDDAWPPPWMQPPYVTDERSYFTGRWAGATYLNACTVQIENAEDLDLPEDPATPDPQPPRDQNACGGGDQVHHTMEPGHELGSETFQLRTVVFGSSHRDAQRNVVQNVPYRLRGQDREAGGIVSGALGLASHVFVAQPSTTSTPLGMRVASVSSTIPSSGCGA